MVLRSTRLPLLYMHVAPNYAYCSVKGAVYMQTLRIASIQAPAALPWWPQHRCPAKRSRKPPGAVEYHDAPVAVEQLCSSSTTSQNRHTHLC